MPLRLLHRAESEVPIGPDADVIRTGMNVNVGSIASVKVRGAFENDRDAVQLTEWLCNLCHRRPLWKCLEIGHHSPEWKEEVGRRVHRKTARHDDRGPARAPSDVSKHVSPSSPYQASGPVWRCGAVCILIDGSCGRASAAPSGTLYGAGCAKS